MNSAILSRLDAGIATIQVERTQKVDEPPQVQRPSWIEPAEAPIETVGLTGLLSAFKNSGLTG